MAVMGRSSSWTCLSWIFVFLGCAQPPSNTPKGEERIPVLASVKSGSQEVAENARLSASGGMADGIQVGVFYMPSWNTSSDPKVDIDSFWACLMGTKDCSFTQNTNVWGPRGRIYNNRYPYEGPFLDKRPHPSLKGFYKRDDPEVARQQILYMKEYGIDFFAYDWFFGRHYYYHKAYEPQSRIYYPEGWDVDEQQSGRVKVPGIEQWETQLHVLLEENAKLPKSQQIKFALNWCDDSDERWLDWLKMASPENIRAKVNSSEERPDKSLYLQVHDKITMLWIDQYFGRDDYLKDERGRPVLYIYFPHDTEARASFYGISLKSLLDRSDALAKKAGLPGIKFVAVTDGVMSERMRPYGMPTTWKPTDPQRPWLGGSYGSRMLMQEYVPRLKEMGFEGMTAYVYHYYRDRDNRSYRDMRNTYRSHWKDWSEYFKTDSRFEYQVPVAMGWDRRPAGGSWPQTNGFPSEPEKDRVISTKATFKAKLEEAKQVVEQYKPDNGNTVMVCCWNEYLEGNHIEPTEGHGFGYLEAIKEVFR